jgi:hypothetical protein
MASTTQSEMDSKKVEPNLGRAVSDYGAAFGVVLDSMGDKAGIYKAMAFQLPLTSSEVASRSGAKDRYIREWLINQVAGRLCRIDPGTNKYILSEDRGYLQYRIFTIQAMLQKLHLINSSISN